MTNPFDPANPVPFYVSQDDADGSQSVSWPIMKARESARVPRAGITWDAVYDSLDNGIRTLIAGSFAYTISLVEEGQ